MFQKRLEIPFAPLHCSRQLIDQPGHCFLFSSLQAYGLGRFSILVANPTEQLEVFSDRIRIRKGNTETIERANFFDYLKRNLDVVEREHAESELPFHGGYLGYVSYDAGRILEERSLAACSTNEVLGRFGRYQSGVVFDHLKQETWLVAESEDALASQSTNDLESILCSNRLIQHPRFRIRQELQSDFTREEFEASVEWIRGAISEGEVYQVNLAQRYSAACEGHAYGLFEKLSEISPAPYSAYLKIGDESIVSSSPERFLQVQDGWARTRPIKGTRPSGAFPQETERNLEDLRHSEKDRSELLMIVDLERNDLGKVCEPGSVRVEELFRLEQYATVIHQTAEVLGKLEQSCTAVDCFRAMFPGGSITGAPKLRSMQIIDELEKSSRGVYTGAIGYFDRYGRADFNIAIRTLRVANGEVSFKVGGGIVWNSDPAAEYEETLVKARAMREALSEDGE